MRSLDEYAALVNQNLLSALPKPGEYDAKLIEACAYSLLSPGKRLRGSLALAGAEYAGAAVSAAMPFALAVECVHAYSLIHDDLPAMDNDVLRRGKPTNHVVYGEAMAILAGDALLSQSLLLMSQAVLENGERAAKAMHTLTAALGIGGMVGGQAQDILSDGAMLRDESALRYIQLHKTAALIRAPLVAGLQAAGAGEEVVASFGEYGNHLGVAFQIADDILDVTADAKTLGKSVGKDEQENKLTAVSVYGLDGARRLLREQTRAALSALRDLPDTRFFAELALKLEKRAC